jgi:hypothetical protein
MSGELKRKRPWPIFGFCPVISAGGRKIVGVACLRAQIRTVDLQGH